MTFLLFNRFNNIFNRNRNINQINNINRYLIKNNENETNGNFIFNDYNEEKKETITFIIKSNNSKEFFKKKLTKKNKDDKNKNNNNKNLLFIDNFKFHGKKYDSPEIKNMRRIKFIETLIQQKNKDNILNDNEKDDKEDKNKFENNNNINTNNDKYNNMLKEKIKNMDIQIDSTGTHLRNVDREIQSCLANARTRFEEDTKNIFGEDYVIK